MYFNTHLMLFRMGKLRLNVHHKNEMHKKYGFYPVRIPLKAISVLTVSVPLNGADHLSHAVRFATSIILIVGCGGCPQGTGYHHSVPW